MRNEQPGGSRRKPKEGDGGGGGRQGEATRFRRGERSGKGVQRSGKGNDLRGLSGGPGRARRIFFIGGAEGGGGLVAGAGPSVGGMAGGGALGPGDVACLVGYFAAMFGVGLRASCPARGGGGAGRGGARCGAEGAGGRGEEYFLADRAASWWAVAASVFSSNIGAEHFVGLAGTAAFSGVAVGFYEWGAVLCIFVLAYLFLPVFLQSAVATMPEFLERRYSPGVRTVTVWLSLVLYVLTKIGGTLYAGDLILQQVLGVDPKFAAISLIAVTTLYTAAGGLLAVIQTEIVQTVVLLVGGIAMLGVSMAEVGGYGGLQTGLQGLVPETYFHIFRPASDPDFPWTGLAFGYFVLSIWYWSCDQVMVQRALAARNVQHGRAGCIGASALKLLPGFLMAFPGMAARLLMTRAGAITPESEKVVYDGAFPWMVMHVMPRNTRGLIIAAMLSALMSSLASIFNSCSTIAALDVYKVMKPAASERELVLFGRCAVAVVAVLSILWLPVIPLFNQNMFLAVQRPSGYSAPPLLCLFLYGVLSQRVNAFGALVCLGVGLSVGALKFLLECIELANPGMFNGAPALAVFVHFNFLNYATISFVICSAIMWIASIWHDARGGASPRKDVSAFLWRRSLYDRLMEHTLYSPATSPELSPDEEDGGAGELALTPRRKNEAEDATLVFNSGASEGSSTGKGMGSGRRGRGADRGSRKTSGRGAPRKWGFRRWKVTIDIAAAAVLVLDLLILFLLA